MKIWVDTLTFSKDRPDECGPNECPDPYIYANRICSFMENEREQMHTGMLQHSLPLHVQECGYQTWLVCNPTGSGSIAILDAEAMFLFKLFTSPATISQVAHTVPGWSGELIEEAVTLFYKLGFLQHINVPSLPHPWDESQQLTVWMHVTNECNLRCHYCYLTKTSEHMAADTARKAVDAVFRSAIKHNINRIRLKYAGGEASLHMASVMALHDYASQLAQRHAITLEATILSNGVALSQHTIENLKARHIGVMISLDGLGAYHDGQRPFINGRGSFQYVLRTIDRLLANTIVPHIAITVSRRNLDGLSDLVKYILEREMPFTLSYYRDNECSTHISDLRFEEKQLIDAMRFVFGTIERNLPRRSLLGCLVDKANLRVLHQHTCGVGHNYLVIDQNGGVAKCQADIKRTVTTVYIDDPLQMIRDDRSGIQALSVDEKQGCRTCEWRYWCTGGCPLLTYRATGRFDVKSPNCNIYKALFPEVLRLEALRLLHYETPIVLSNTRNMSVAVLH